MTIDEDWRVNVRLASHSSIVRVKPLFFISSFCLVSGPRCSFPLSYILKVKLFLLFSVRLLSVLRGHSGFSSPPQRPMTSDFEGFSIQDVIHYIYFPILILEKEPVFHFLMLSAKQGNNWYHLYNVFGMTRSLTGD